MTKECLGCGSVLQTESPGKEGFVKSSVYDKSSYCERCFKIKHYGEYSVLDKKDIVKVYGIGEKTYEKIKDSICVSYDSIDIQYVSNSDRYGHI